MHLEYTKKNNKVLVHLMKPVSKLNLHKPVEANTSKFVLSMLFKSVN